MEEYDAFTVVVGAAVGGADRWPFYSGAILAGTDWLPFIPVRGRHFSLGPELSVLSGSRLSSQGR
jgi:hypothetical protein